MPPLLQRLTERKPENLDYLGVSYGLTPQLLRYVLLPTLHVHMVTVAITRFWKRARYVPLYVRQTTSELTGEHTCVMVRGLNSSVESEMGWLNEFAKGMQLFECRTSLLTPLRRFPPQILDRSFLQIPRIRQCHSPQHSRGCERWNQGRHRRKWYAFHLRIWPPHYLCSRLKN